MSTYNSIKNRIRLELSEMAQITFLDEELLAYTIEGCRILHGIIASINPLFVMSGKKTYFKLSDYLPYNAMQWYTDYLEASQLVAVHNYLDVNEDGVVNELDYNSIVAMDTTIDGVNQMYEFLKANNKASEIVLEEIPLPDNCMFIDNIFVQKDGANYRLLPKNLDIVMYHQATIGTPFMFCRTGNKLTISPTPDKFYKYTLAYASSYIEPVAFDDGLSIPDMFIPYVVEYVVIRAHNRNDRKTLVEQIFLNQKGSLIQSLITKESMEMQIIPTLTNNPYLTRW